MNELGGRFSNDRGPEQCVRFAIEHALYEPLLVAEHSSASIIAVGSAPNDDASAGLTGLGLGQSDH